MKISRLLAVSGLSILGIGAALPSSAATKTQIDEKVAATVTEFNSLHTGNVKLSKKAAGVLIFPKVTKGGIGIAGEYGEGVLQVGGKTVGYYSIGAASVGLTLGLANHSEVILFMNQESLDKFTASDGWSIGADTGITVVSKGANGEYDSLTEQKPILAFGFGEKGLIGDLSLNGSKISRIKE